MTTIIESFPQRLKQLRTESGLTLDALATCSGVSRSMISKIERGEANPTASILAQLAEGLDVTISYLLGEQPHRNIVVMRRLEQIVFKDPVTGTERRSLGPNAVGRAIDFVSYSIPPGQKAGPFVPHPPGVTEFIVMTHGSMIAILGEHQIVLNTGDSLTYSANLDHCYENPNPDPCEFHLVISDDGRREFRVGPS